ncbi:MAG: serine/threonine-protein kinase [Synechocystis sp.]|nr:serine/threonine-protein kinase [Synechocystis sp.]
MVTPLLNNRYQIIETLGRGGFGETFLAKDTHMPSARYCVIKHLKPVLESPEIPQWLRDRFQREATILEELGESHPQIPNLYAYFSEGDDFYLVQEWVPGLTLGQAQEKRGNFSSTAVEELLLGILPVLAFIHQRRIIHRDIKPDNIILRQGDGQPILIDFGIIKETMGTLVNPDGRSAYSVAIGTPGYMAPEQAAGRPVFSSDLYSLGLTAIFLLTGKSPQYLKSDSRTGEILWQSEAPYVSPNLVAVLNQAIRYHPRERFKSAQEMRQALLGGAQSYQNTVSPRSNPSPRNAPTQHTAPTVVVGGNPRHYGDTGVTTTGPDSQNFTEYEEDPGTSPLLTWFVMPLVFLLVIVGGIVAGFWVANQRRSVPPVIEATPTPTPTLPPIESTPNLFATPEPTPRPPRATPTPTPVPSAMATPEPTPNGEETPPVAETPMPDQPSPPPETDPSPGTPPPVNQTPAPIPVITPPVQSTPKPKPTPQATPKPTPTPKPQPTPTPPPANPLEVIPPPQDPTNNSTVTPPAPPAIEKKTAPGDN